MYVKKTSDGVYKFIQPIHNLAYLENENLFTNGVTCTRAARIEHDEPEIFLRVKTAHHYFL